MMTFDHGDGEVEFEGNTFSLSHLKNRQIEIRIDESSTLVAEITCSSHCYTDNPTSAKTQLEIKDHYGNKRYFCPKRYELSKNLHTWLENCADQICIKSTSPSGAIHWLIIEDHESGEKISIVFEIEKHNTIENAVYIMVKAVHAFDRKAPPTPSERDVTFKVVGSSYAKNNDAPPRAKKRKRKRKKNSSETKKDS
ncbi:hypothetical protein FP371_25355 [Citrobacter freundii]|uniref:hypothetical protein n=1 Tax=Gammaproteobacteria TaxID=1236 RepID=UPI001C952F7D|nr:MULTISPECIES: hypothetical protein [Gammaproteobacteria]MBY5301518.1 hypothetical protein [Citrobacter freundii]MCG6813869.1 hypothetical protein [Pseudomonas aeruginosa]MDN2488627.1 hypothetical protein [Kosakonia sacchari]HCJ9324312.1 hypothetical protein [Escherichia coli]